MKQAVAYANANIALVKYWGKNDGPYNIPAVSSLSMTLSGMGTKVMLASSDFSNHVINVQGNDAEPLVKNRVSSYLEQVRAFFPYDGFLKIDSISSVPFASGLASSASFFAATACVLNRALDLNLDVKAQSMLARLGSGSAARSLYSNFAGLHGGFGLNHDEAFAFPLEVHQDLDLAMVIVVVDTHKKAISSTEAMNATKNTSPFFSAFLSSSKNDHDDAILALKTGSFTRLGEIMEHSTLKMFATMWSATPFINYWQPATLSVVNLVLALRKKHGPIAYFTMDAGPNVKILCSNASLPIVTHALAEIFSPQTFHVIKPGAGAKIIDGET